MFADVKPPPPPRAAWAARDCAPDDVWMAGVAPDSKSQLPTETIKQKNLFERNMQHLNVKMSPRNLH